MISMPQRRRGLRRRACAALFAAGWALVLSVGAVAPIEAQVQTGPSSVDGEAAVKTVTEGVEEIIVRGRRIGELRAAVERAEEAVFARFNEINSTDDFDIHCRSEKFYGFLYRFCMSNSWRHLGGKMGSEAAASMGGPGRANPGLVVKYRKQQLEMQKQLIAEMQRLTAEDEQLKQANEDLAAAQYALMLRRGTQTLSRQAPPQLVLPYGAKSLFEVIIGNSPWRHPLTERTFTIANVFGELHKLEIECAEGSQRVDYKFGVEWTLPNSWSSCVLQVRAKRETTFRLYEF